MPSPRLIIAGVGSRKAPPGVCDDLQAIGAYVRELGGWVRSGHADGADWAFEKGARDRCLVYLPWRSFNSHLPLLGEFVVPPVSETRDALLGKAEPGAFKRSRGVLALKRRNVCQVLGLSGEDPVQAVVCYTPQGKKVGGTALAIRLAELWGGIPVYNLGGSFVTIESVKKALSLFVDDS